MIFLESVTVLGCSELLNSGGGRQPGDKQTNRQWQRPVEHRLMNRVSGREESGQLLDNGLVRMVLYDRWGLVSEVCFSGAAGREQDALAALRALSTEICSRGTDVGPEVS